MLSLIFYVAVLLHAILNREQVYAQYTEIALILYLFLISIKIINPFVPKSAEALLMVIVTAFGISLIGFIVFIIKSFISQSKYYDLIGKKESQLNPLLYFTAGAFLYFIMYFVFRKQMKEDINLIR